MRRALAPYTRIYMGVDLQEDDDAGAGEEFSAMAWEIASRGKNGREVARLHESWAATLLARDAFDKAQVLSI